jgi:two-component system LytT family sensor kinase
MLSAVTLRDPILINTIGHMAGLLLFAVMIALLIRDRRSHGIRQTRLSIAAAALALAWNVGSLVALASPDASSRFVAIVMAVSFSVLSLLPAILLQVAVRRQQQTIVGLGYLISLCAVALHVSELFSASVLPHQVALLLVAIGFGGLTIAAFLIGRARYKDSTELLSLACLLLFTTSFPHFGYQHVGSPWSLEITWHHIGVPVALVVLLRDYRFLLLDTFVRFLMNSALASGYLTAVLLLSQRFSLWKRMADSHFLTGLILVALCLSLILFADIRNRLQRWIGKVIFRRQNLEERLTKISQLHSTARSETDLIARAAREVARHLRTEQFEVVAQPSEESDQPVILFRGEQIQHLPKALFWAEAQIPLRLSGGELRFLLTGPRAGRQRYLSEDLEDMRQLGSAIVEQVERFRSEELKRLATKAELRALQSQINPHFLFNALNTLYGSIDRESHQARQMVLNLAEIFRYFLQGERSFIPLSEELRIVRAYLEIEMLRLGDRLETEIAVSEAAKTAMIPILSIQPLVENAVKHGVSAKMKGGRVTVRAHVSDKQLLVAVSDTGNGFDPNQASEGIGIGLENVRRRLLLSYGAGMAFDIASNADGSSVSFQIPVLAEHAAASNVEVGVRS